MLMANVAERVFSLIKATVEAEGVELWDVRFLKEGASWYLRVFIDKQDGISIDDCTNVSHAIDPVIDEADPIDKAYYLEVCSAGLERELVREEHFVKYIGKKIRIRLYKAKDSVKEFTGILKQYGDEVVLETENGEITFEKQNISKANAFDFEEE
ncbi:MAG: ribosome maturation factor RimP [Clostridia bacterium]|nr:ribosome maturation factor RimP [Clostridia bacterium]